MIEQKKSSVVKQPYFNPVIRVYGTIRAITQAAGSQGNSDNGAGTNKRSRGN